MLTLLALLLGAATAEAEREPEMSLNEIGDDKVSFASGISQGKVEIYLVGRIPHQGNVDIQQERLLP